MPFFLYEWVCFISACWDATKIIVTIKIQNVSLSNLFDAEIVLVSEIKLFAKENHWRRIDFMHILFWNQLLFILNCEILRLPHRIQTRKPVWMAIFHFCLPKTMLRIFVDSEKEFAGFSSFVLFMLSAVTWHSVLHLCFLGLPVCINYNIQLLPFTNQITTSCIQYFCINRWKRVTHFVWL